MRSELALNELRSQQATKEKRWVCKLFQVVLLNKMQASGFSRVIIIAAEIPDGLGDKVGSATSTGYTGVLI